MIVIPPPNVTGSLHIGHALTNAIEVRQIASAPLLQPQAADHAASMHLPLPCSSVLLAE